MSDEPQADQIISNTSPPPPPELLAPAGDRACLEAALEAGAEAVYLGLTTLNARRRAPNFSPEELGDVVALVHGHGARAYLALNVDVTERELGQAACILELARQAGVDAVLIRDPALMAWQAEFPELEFHFSTQTCMANSADVTAARELGAARVVLARELTLAEIAAASAVPGIQTEVFVQGALCFCVSGRCLLSSWVGGRSGNRGTCTSPCRVPWTIDEEPAGTPFSMRDLSVLQRLDELRRAGVAGLKIEGRLKNAEWVRRAVQLYRRGLDGEEVAATETATVQLGAYTGRLLTDGYLDGRRDELTGVAGREARRPAPQATEPSQPIVLPECGEGAESAAVAESDEGQPEPADRTDQWTYEFEIDVTGKSIECRCACREVTETWTMPKTVVRRKHKAVSIDHLLRYLADTPQGGCELSRGQTDDPDFLMVPRARNVLIDRITKVIHRARKVRTRDLDIALPESVQALLEPGEPHPANRRLLGGEPDRVRLDADDVERFLEAVRPDAVIAEHVTADTLRQVQRACRRVPLIVALPPVFFEDDLPAMQALVQQCARARVVVEVNSWGGWRLAKEARARLEGGPGLPVLNSWAARRLMHCGLDCVTVSVEADRRQLEELSAVCPVSTSLVVFGRPPLLTTRTAFGEGTAGRVFEDRRGVRLIPRREGGLWVFRPEQPFDLRTCDNERICVRHLVVDLVGSPAPLSDWHDLRSRNQSRFRFNYDRQLA